MAKMKDLTGTHIGDIYVERKATSKTAATYWYCRCKCGKNIKLSTRKLNSNIQDCGFCKKTRKDKSTFNK